jgi:AraC-like DNA-binding protein
LEWVTWPHLSPGIRRLKLPVSLRPSVLGELTFADSVLRGGLPASELLATNAVERVLLYCEPVNIAHGESLKHPRIQAAADFLARNLRDRHSLQALAKRFGFSRSRFAALFRRQVGQTPFEYLESRRLLRAREHLVYSNQTLQQIADNVGFSSPFYLSLRFKKLFGKNPKTFRLHGIAGSLAGKPAARPPCGMV